MLSPFLSALVIVLIAVILLVLFVVICLVASPKDREEEDIEQMNFLKQYLKGKDERD